MSRFDELKDAGWTPIAGYIFDDLPHECGSEEAQKAALKRLFRERGLDIEKPHRKDWEKEREAWFFKQDDSGEVITLDSLKKRD